MGMPGDVIQWHGNASPEILFMRTRWRRRLTLLVFFPEGLCVVRSTQGALSEQRSHPAVLGIPFVRMRWKEMITLPAIFPGRVSPGSDGTGMLRGNPFHAHSIESDYKKEVIYNISGDESWVISKL